MKLTKGQDQAVSELVELVKEIIGAGWNEKDAVDAISNTARLAGSFLFRSFNFNISHAKPGTAVLSEEANLRGPGFINLILSVLENFGVRIDNNKMYKGEQKQPASSFLDALGELQTPALKIMEKHALNYEQMAQTAAIATAFMIRHNKILSPEEGFEIALYHFIEGSKTYPPDFIPAPAIEPVKEIRQYPGITKPWWKFW